MTTISARATPDLFRRLASRYAEAAAIAASEADRDEWERHSRELLSLYDRYRNLTPAVRTKVDHLLSEEQRRVEQHIARRIALGLI